MSKQYETGFARVDAVIRSIENGPEIGDVAETPEKAHFYQLRAAGNVDIFEPYTEEQAALNHYLTRKRAGKKLCDYAWRLFAQSF